MSKEQRYSKRRTALKQEKEDVIWEMKLLEQYVMFGER
jgi:hypothetical protein